MSDGVNRGIGGNSLEWSEELDEQEQSRRKRLIERVDELAHTGVLNRMDCLIIYEILVRATQREQINVFEQYMIDCVNEEADLE